MRRTSFVTITAIVLAIVSGGPAFASPVGTTTCEAKVATAAETPIFGGPPSGRSYMGQLVLRGSSKLTIDAVTGDHFATGHSDGTRRWYRIVPEEGLFYTDYSDTLVQLTQPAWVSREALQQQRKWVRCEPSLPALDLGPGSSDS